MMTRAAAGLLTVFAMTLSAQSPPAILQIVEERIYPGDEQEYGQIEEELRKLCERCPNRYLALATVSEPREVWWLNLYASQEDVERVAKAYADDPELTSAMRALAAGKQGLTSEPVDLMSSLRSDLSDASPWRIGELAYAVIYEMPAPARAMGAVYQLPDGRAVAIVAAADRAQADLIAATLGSPARVFQVRPEWSRPYDEWIARNPALWRR